jgi:hypothetical protein
VFLLTLQQVAVQQEELQRVTFHLLAQLEEFQ